MCPTSPERVPHRTVWDTRTTQPEIAGPFADLEELVAHIARVTGATPTSPTSIRGHASRRGTYQRLRQDGTLAHSTGDPILDSTLTAAGELNVDGRSAQPSRPPTPLAADDDCEVLGNGLTKCTSADGTTVTFGDATGTVTFNAFTDSTAYLYRKIGAKVTTRGGNFEAARIDSRYYDVAYAQTVGDVAYDHDSAFDDNSVEEFEYAIFADVPRRVESLCRVQWHGHRLAAIVSKGNIDDYFVVGGVAPFPDGWPDDWPDLEPSAAPPEVTTAPTSLRFAARITEPISTKTILITSTFDADQIVRVVDIVHHTPTTAQRPGHQPQEPGPNPFSATRDPLTVPADGQRTVTVTFDGTKTASNDGNFSVPQPAEGTLLLQTPSGIHRISLYGQLHQVFANS